MSIIFIEKKRKISLGFVSLSSTQISLTSYILTYIFNCTFTHVLLRVFTLKLLN